MKRGKAVVTLFPVRHVCFCEKVMFREQIVPAYVAQRLTGLKAVVTKQGENDLNFPCRIVCTVLAICLRYNLNQCPLGVQELAYSSCIVRCMRRIHTKRLHLAGTYPLVRVELTAPA